jgi:carboxypeptidase PM20D1
MEQNQMPVNFAGPVGQLCEYLGPEMPLIQKVLFANRWLFESVIVSQLEKIGSMNAILRTTTAPTMISGGVKENVLLSKAYVRINFRILSGNTPDNVVAHAKKVIADPAVEVSLI